MGKSDWMVWTVKRETKDCLVLLERRGILEDGVIKDLEERKEREETLGFEGTRVTQDKTASREDPKEKPVTLALWVSQGEMEHLEDLEKLGRMVALAEGDPLELRATRAVQASRASRESRGPEVHRAHLVLLVLQA